MKSVGRSYRDMKIFKGGVRNGHPFYFASSGQKCPFTCQESEATVRTYYKEIKVYIFSQLLKPLGHKGLTGDEKLPEIT